MSNALSNWEITDVRTVPGIMYQVRCGHDEFDQTIEYQINWFLDCTETFIHNHRHSFITYCLEGQYIEKLWEMVDEGDHQFGYQFRRHIDGTFDLPKIVPGTLRHTKTRRHFPGNQMFVNTSQFHSISPIAQSDSRVLTFLVKRNYFPVRDIFVLSMKSELQSIKDLIRPATDDERHAIYEKLHHVFTSNLHY